MGLMALLEGQRQCSGWVNDAGWGMRRVQAAGNTGGSGVGDFHCWDRDGSVVCSFGRDLSDHGVQASAQHHHSVQHELAPQEPHPLLFEMLPGTVTPHCPGAAVPGFHSPSQNTE